MDGENGILTQAEDAKLKTDISSDTEQLQLYYVEKSANSKNGALGMDDYLNYIEEKGIPIKEEDGKKYAEMDGRLYELKMENEDLEVEYVGKGKITDPRIQSITIVNKTLSSIEIEVKATRLDKGTFIYYIGTNESNLIEQGRNQTGSYTFNDLTAGNTYYIKVVGENNEGQSTEKTISTEIESIPDATSENIKYTISWNNGYATIKLSTTSGYIIQTSKDHSTYTSNSTVTGLNSGDMVYARLSNGTYYGSEISIQVLDNTKPELTLTKGSTTTKSISVNAKAKDSESGMSGKPYKYYISNSEGEFSSTPSGTNTTGQFTFDNLDQNTQYTIKVEIEDVAGNKQTSTIKINTELIPGAEQAITRNVSWNSDGTVQIILNTSTEFSILYSKNRSNWDSYPESGITVNNGERIYICLSDGKNKGADYGLEVSDHQGPDVTITKGNVSSNSITVNVEAQDRGAGMETSPKYNYYIKGNDENDYRLIGEDSLVSTYTFTGLTAQTIYNIKVVTSDILGNQGEGTIDITTDEFTYISGNVEFGSVNWQNKLASVSITNNTMHTMQYKIIKKGEEIDLNGEWQTASSKTTIIGNLKDDYQIISRLSDGVNISGYATLRIEDNVAPTIQVSGLSTEWTKENVTVTVNAEDNESGLQENCYSFDGGATWQAENTRTYETNTTGIVIKVRDEAGNIGTYNTINITNIDKEGPAINVDTETTSNSITINVTSISDSGIGLDTVPTYTYYLTKNNAELETMTGEQSTEKTKSYTGLIQNTTYYIKVEVADKLGNTTKSYKTISTGSLDASSKDLSISNPVWSNKKASAIIVNSSTYNMEYQVVKSGEVFDQNNNWTMTTEKTVTISDLLNNYAIYARLTDGDNVSGTVVKEIKDETVPQITITGNSEEWTKENITLTINASDSESGLQQNCYSFDGGLTWQAENIKTYETNTAGIVIQVKDEAGNIATETVEITKIDKEGPNIVLQEDTTTTKQIAINVPSITDAGVGVAEMPTYTYYLKKEGDAGYTKQEDTQNTTFTFTKLKSGTKYTIKVEVSDKLGNVGEKTIDITTKNMIYQQDITATDLIWSNGLAQVTLNNSSSNYDMQYQISRNGASINLNGTWTTVTEKSIDVKNLSDGDIIYARLTDGVNVTSGYATCNVSNSAKKTYTESELANQTTRENYNVLGISAASNEIKVQIGENQENAATYNYYYKTINDEQYTLISTNSYYNQAATIDDVKEGAIYKIKVLVTDTNGNVTRSENTATVVAEAEAEVNQVYSENRTYIDRSKKLDSIDQEEKIQAGYTISIPAAFKVSSETGENTLENGVVLKDSSSNEYVWIPVNDAIYDGLTDIPTNSGNASITYKPMAKRQSGYTDYYESLVYTFNNVNSWINLSNTGIGKVGYREPSLITNYTNDGYTWNVPNTSGTLYDADAQYYRDILGFESTSDFGIYLQSSYNNMITSVDSYGGFYVGRYETTTDSTGENIIVGSKENSKVLSENNWYKMYLYQDSEKYSQNPYSNIASVNSNMMWGSQWDAMLNYILRGNDKQKVTKQIANQKNQPSESKKDSQDVISNIYDLSSNLYGLTQEANNTSYRTYRGGSYDKSSSGDSSYRRTVIPTDQGPVFGTRMGLYLKSTTDVTGPVAKINKTSSTSNSITVEASAVDKETGVSKYRYYIGEFESSLSLVGEANTDTYTYTGLVQNRKYIVKVEAVDGAGNVGEGVQAEVTTSSLGSVAKTAITRIQKYGSNGSGIIQLQLDETYKNTGYYIQYQVLEQGESLQLDGTWQTGETISNLSNNQTIYAILYDGKNRSDDYYSEVVDGLEEYTYIDKEGNRYTQEEAQEQPNKTTYDTTINYTDENNNTATIPAGFKVGITDSVKLVNNGLVIRDSSGNEYVWVPVDTVIETDESSSTKPMARYQSGYNSSSSKKYYEGILYDFTGTTSTKKATNSVLGLSTWREPTLISGGADYTWNVLKGSANGQTYDLLEQYYKNMSFGVKGGVNVFNSYTEFGQYMNEEYSNMIQSVDKYKGFYVARYETSLEGTVTNKDAVVQSKIGQSPIYNKNWYYNYYYQDSNINPKNPYYSSKSVTSSMIWGSQWDAIMNWLLKDDKTKDFVTKITGNHTDEIAKTGTYTNDLAKNIFDLSSNVTEWTQEGQGTSYRMYRGGHCVTTSDKYASSAMARYSSWMPPTMTTVYTNATGGNDVQKNHLGSRMSLYINDVTDTTLPTVEIQGTTAGTNNIEISVNAIDNESGISKYRYSLSYSNFTDSSFNEQTDILKTVEAYGNTYTFEELNQNQTYYIRVEAENGAGKSSNVCSDAIKTNVLNVQSGAIILEKVYGKNENGIAYFEISDETNFEQEGYYLQHQIDKGGINGYKEADSNWTIKGNTVTGLSVGDKIYTRIYDGRNKAEYYKTTTIDELETFSETYTVTTEYKDYATVEKEDGTSEQVLEGTAYIPAGFKVATSNLTKKIKNGLVIEDEAGNQYVWIPVKDVIYDGETAMSSTYKPMVRYQQGYNKNSAQKYFEGVYYSFSGTTSSGSTGYRLGVGSYREPSLVTNSTANYSWIYTAGNDYDATNYNLLSGLGINSATQMGTYLNNKYTEMVESIEKYGGYYVGRYETSTWETDNWATGGVNKENTGNIVKSVPNAVTMASTNWYNMYLKQDSGFEENPYNTSSSVTSGMIWGSQWDTMLNYILQGSDKEKVTAVTGNHSGTRAKTGQYGNDIMNNIFDLSSNVREWTSDAYGATSRTGRGGFYNVGDFYPASSRNLNYPTYPNYNFGSRLSLYLK